MQLVAPLLACILLAACTLSQAHAAIEVHDDTGRVVALQHPARRIVALSPQLVELSYAAGAGDKLAATIRGADQPPQARKLPRVGDAFALNLEAIVSLRPDLILAWKSGTPPRQADVLQHLGIPVYWSQTDTLQSIAETVRRLGELAGTQASANTWVHDYGARLSALQGRFAHQQPVRVFYQAWGDPLMTVGGPQLINQAIELCGGTNPFAALPVLAPAVSREAVIAANPQLIVAASPDTKTLNAWKRFTEISAVRRKQLVVLNPDQLPRMGAHVLDGVAHLCSAIDHARRMDSTR